MAFHKSSQNITLKDNHILTGNCRTRKNAWLYSEIDLNKYLGNVNGKFHWGDNSFTKSASQVHLALEGGEGRPMLHAQLNDRHGGVQSASVDLGESIRNEGGELVFRPVGS
ncbi:hypothetical protein ASPWEDRAFT_173194 [Aspergillus wentii DTO 134E9]|uniref:Cyanovirin-N domain-containing protein n=1 Tax=Aspergillus wentii DTO 134E9 TaxID=1073089 RepID=A0A1L9RFR7_ASPWE|nr:uncharacterized protein ASPWEDRAFT_173194 [Aspergillus wentii DTO 134E9]KAI9925520.1 hypothetical protein MW887_005901 [Aspergillus wentii]OJJ33762.1 hypothetical protein ASPWEDRAFT_173194 [Aspergillus wentii DTO 134E9]